MSKTAYFGMHARFNKELRLTASHKFRSKDDVITPLLHHAFVQYGELIYFFKVRIQSMDISAETGWLKVVSPSHSLGLTSPLRRRVLFPRD